VTPFLPEQYVMLALIFVLGLVLGMYLFAGTKWKRRYKEEARLRADLEAENARLRKDAAEADALRNAAVRSPARDPAHRGPL
jgi:hypothetical protein